MNEKNLTKKIITKAPCRIDLSSGAIDWCGLSTLSLAVDLYATASVSKREDNLVSISHNGKEHLFDPLSSTKDFIELTIQKTGKTGFNLEYSTEIPKQSGLGGSASLAVAILAAIHKLHGEKVDRYRLAEIAQRIETHDIGSVQGYQDQYAAALGGCLLMDFKYKSSKEIDLEPYAIVEQLYAQYTSRINPKILLVNSSCEHSSSAENSILLSKYQNKDEEVMTLFAELDILSRKMKAAILHGNKEEFYSIINRNQEIMKCFNRSNIFNEQIISLAKKYGAKAAKCTGAGNAAVALFFDDEVSMNEVEQELQQLPFVNFICEVKPTRGVKKFESTIFDKEKNKGIQIDKMVDRLFMVRPWGHFEQFTENDTTTVKILAITAKERISYQYHKKREEFWKVIDGEGYALLNGKCIDLVKGDEILIRKLDKHSLGSETGMKVLEISFGDFDEEDIYRLEDKYGREIS